MINRKHAALFFSLSLLVLAIDVHAFPDKGFTRHVFHNGKLIELKDGINLSGKGFGHIVINRELGELRNIDFSRSNMCYSDLDETRFVGCSFRGANLCYADAPDPVGFVGCDFTDSLVAGSNIVLSKEQLITTMSFKHKQLPKYRFRGDLSGLDFSDFNLEGANFSSAKLMGCKFDNARITEASIFSTLTKEQLLSTKDFKEGTIIGVSLGSMDFSEMDLSGMNFSGCKFKMTNFQNTNLADAVISNCIFVGLETLWDTSAKNLTLEQIKSTWNYKMGRMEGVKLPKDIQDALDAEKKKEDKSLTSP